MIVDHQHTVPTPYKEGIGHLTCYQVCFSSWSNSAMKFQCSNALAGTQIVAPALNHLN
eukprot:SAG22_NODE_11736_length_471_cov_1.228495_1_plen_57_part_10